MASAERPRIQGLIHILLYILRKQESASLHTSLAMNQTSSSGFGREASDPRPHTHTTLHPQKQESASLHMWEPTFSMEYGNTDPNSVFYHANLGII